MFFFCPKKMCGDFWFGKFGGEMFLLWGLQKTRVNSVSKNAEDRSVQSISGSKRNKWWKEWSLVLLDPAQLVMSRTVPSSYSAYGNPEWA